MSTTVITGEALIAGQAVKGTGAVLRAWDPTAGKALDAEFYAVDNAQIDAACRAAEAAFDTFRSISDEQRAVFLETIAAQIVELGDTLVERAVAETGLPRARIEGERGRTVGQLKLFATLLREGSWNDVRIDQALPDRAPPRPDLRLRMIGLGPVAVFAASNFPLAFSVAGGDTASAFAAGCPVVLAPRSWSVVRLPRPWKSAVCPAAYSRCSPAPATPSARNWCAIRPSRPWALPVRAAAAWH